MNYCEGLIFVTYTNATYLQNVMYENTCQSLQHRIYRHASIDESESEDYDVERCWKITTRDDDQPAFTCIGLRSGVQGISRWILETFATLLVIS